MMLPLHFLRSRWRLLAFGLLMTFCSGFGQTYFISIFGGAIRDEFDLGHAAYGTSYSAGTLLSACALLWAGRLVDRMALATFSVAAIVGLSISTAGLTVASSWLGLGLIFFALRFFGQGLTTHAAMTAMGRYFSGERGRAVSFAALGHVAGQAILPLTAVALLGYLQWRSVWLIGGTMLVLVAVPAILLLLRTHDERQNASSGAATHAAASHPSCDARDRGQDLDLSQALHDPGLYLRLPVLLAPSFISTGFIFHQVYIGAQKGWSLTLLASSLSAYAIGSFAMTIVTGTLVDSVSARRLVPVCLAPLASSCLVLMLATGTAGALAFFILLGVGSGLTSVMFGAIWAELYGVTHLGAIRAFGTSAMVFASGLAPIVMGVMIDWSLSIEMIAAGCIACCIAAAAISTLARDPPRR